MRRRPRSARIRSRTARASLTSSRPASFAASISAATSAVVCSRVAASSASVVGAQLGDLASRRWPASRWRRRSPPPRARRPRSAPRRASRRRRRRPPRASRSAAASAAAVSSSAVVLGPRADLLGRLLRRPQHARGLLAERVEQPVLGDERRVLELLLQLRDLAPASASSRRERGRHLVGDALQEVADLELADAAERGGEPAGRDLVGGQARRARRRAAVDVSHGVTLGAITAHHGIGVPSGSRGPPPSAQAGARPGSRRRRCSAGRASAWSRVVTPTTFMSPALRPGVAHLGARHDHQAWRRRARAATAFCGDPAHLADGAVAVDRAGHRDLLAAGEVAGREVVDDREREREPARRAAHVAGGDLDLRPGSRP